MNILSQIERTMYVLTTLLLTSLPLTWQDTETGGVGKGGKAEKLWLEGRESLVNLSEKQGKYNLIEHQNRFHIILWLFLTYYILTDLLHSFELGQETHYEWTERGTWEI